MEHSLPPAAQLYKEALLPGFLVALWDVGGRFRRGGGGGHSFDDPGDVVGG